LVSECAATFRAVGTETEVPVGGKHPGTVRIPLSFLERIERVLNTFKGKELNFVCEPGRVKIGTWSAKHPDIELGTLPNQGISIPVDISVLDTLALAQLLTPEQVVQEGLRARVAVVGAKLFERPVGDVLATVGAVFGVGVEGEALGAAPRPR
jgi:hypothetical protein